MDNGAKIKINKDTGEIEISGSESFVDRHVSLIDSLFNITGSTTAPAETTTAPAPVVEQATVDAPAQPVKRGRGRPRKYPIDTTAQPTAPKVGRPRAPKMASSFSGFLKSFNTKMKKGDLILAAGYYFQQSTKSDNFTTFNASKLLKAQGIELANPSQYMKNNISSKRIRMVDRRTYQVTPGGIAHLNMLMSKG